MESVPRRLRRLTPMRSVRGQMVLVFLLLTLLVLFLISAGLLVGLERYYTNYYTGQLKSVATSVATVLGQLVSGDPATAVEAITQSTPPPLSLPGSGMVVLDAATDHVINESGVSGALTGAQYPLPADLRNPPARGAAGIVRVKGAGEQVWASAPVVVGGKTVAIVVAEYPLEQVYLLIDQIRAVLPLITLLALVVVGGVSYILARTVTGPIGALTRRARAMAAGDLTTRLPVHGPDEVGQLAIVLNHLGRRLQETLREIRAEQGRAAAVLQNMTDGIVVLDAAGRFVSSNSAASALLRLDPASAAGRPSEEVLPPDLFRALLQGAAEAQLASALADGTAPDHPGGGPTLAIGDQRVQLRITPLVDDGQVQGQVIVLYDVTARERLDAMRKELVANVSHELRTPITTVKLYVESLLEWGLEDPTDARGKLSVIAGEVDRMARLIADLLELSKLDEQKIIRQKRRVDVRELAAGVSEQFSPGARDKGIELRVVASGSDFEVDADPDRIVQVMGNLLANALDFTPMGGRIWMRVHGAPSGVRVEVEDTGVGISPDELPRIFERFYRVESSRSRQYGGSGLGLAIAREIVEAHGGSVGIQSQRGQGTTVHFILPRAWGA